MRSNEAVYPIISVDTIMLINDYGNLATGTKVELDFSGIENKNLVNEAMNFIRYKYETKSASVTYLRVLVPAVRCFYEFAKINDIDSFQDYDDELKNVYRDYLNNLEPGGRGQYSETYKRFLLAVPRTIQRGQ